MCLNNLKHEPLASITAQTFLGFKDLASKAFDLEKKLLENKREKKYKETGKVGATVVETKNEIAKKEPMRIPLNKNKDKEKEV